MSETMHAISEKVSDAMERVQEKVLGSSSSGGGDDSSAKQKSAYGFEAAGPGQQMKPTRNLAVVWQGPNKVAVQDIGYPKMATPWGQPIEHGVILRVVVSGICGSDLHMYRGTIAGITPGKMTFGHEITGEVFEMGHDVERFSVGDIVSVPFNISCGRCDNDREGKTNACLRVNKEMAGGAYGYAMMGGWQGGQAEYVLVPYADHQLIKLPKEVAMDKMTSLAFLTDIFPTGFNGAVQAGVCAGSLVYVAGAGPVGLCAAKSAFLLGAAEVFVADKYEDRLALAASIGCKTINLTKLTGGKSDSDAVYAEIERQLPPWKNGPHQLVDCAIDCVGYEACGLGKESDKRVDEQVLNTCFKVVKAGGKIGIPGLYPPADLGGTNSDTKQGVYHLQFGQCWNKGIQLGMGQCPVLQYQKDLMKTILHGRVDLSSLLNVKVISLEEAPEAYKRFNDGEACKYIIDPHGLMRQHQTQQTAQGASATSTTGAK